MTDFMMSDLDLGRLLASAAALGVASDVVRTVLIGAGVAVFLIAVRIGAKRPPRTSEER